MLTMQEAASQFLANERIAVTGVSRKAKDHDSTADVRSGERRSRREEES